MKWPFLKTKSLAVSYPTLLIILFFAFAGKGFGQSIQIQNNQASSDYRWTYPCSTGGVLAQSFTVGANNITVTSADVDVKYYTNSGTLTYEIWSNYSNGGNGDYPNTLITNGTSNGYSITSSNSSYALINCTFSTSPVLTANTKYWIVVKFSNSNGLYVRYSASWSDAASEYNAKSGGSCSTWTGNNYSSEAIIFDIKGTTCVSPTLSGASQAAAVCDGSTATINLTGLVASSTGNAIDYKINGSAQTQVTGVTADGSGNASFTSAALVAANNGQTLQITKITNGTCNTSFSTNATMSVNSLPAASNYTAVGATTCVGSGAVVTVSSNTLATGAYTVTYNVSGTNTVSSTTASMSFTSGTPGTGTFTTSALSSAGAANVVNMTAIAFTSTGCSYTLSSKSTAAFTTSAMPTCTTPSSTPVSYCQNATATALSVTGGAGSGTISTYAWYSSPNSNGSGSTLLATHTSSSTTDTYTPVTTSVRTDYYYVVVTNSNGCSVTSGVSGAVTINAFPAATNFSVSGATSCSGSGTVVTVTSSTLATGTYTVTYNVSGTNTVTSTTASMSFSSGTGTGTFTTSTLSTAGAANVVNCTAIAFSSSTSCTTSLSASTAAFTTNAAPTVSSVSASAATASSGSGAVVIVSSSSLATGTYTVTYNVSGTNSVSSTTASMSFTAGSPGTGTFTTSALSSVGTSNVVNITAIAFSSSLSCTSSLSVSTSSFTTNKVWSGGTSTSWFTSSNWTPSGVPTSSTDIEIPAGTLYSCTIPDNTAHAYCRNITIDAGATLTNQISNVSYGFDIYGDLTVNGTLNHPGSVFIYLNGSSNNFGGTGTTSDLGLDIVSSTNYTLTSNLEVKYFWQSGGSSSTVSIGNNILTTSWFIQQGNFSIGSSGMLRVGGTSTYVNSPDGTSPYFTTGRLTLSSGSIIYYNAGDVYSACSQTVKSITYQNLKINTCNGYIATIGSGSGFTVTSDLTIINPSTAGGTATTVNDITLNGNFYLGNTGNALTLNLANQIVRSSTGTGTFTMGNNDSHAVNVTYANSNGTAWAISLGSSGATTPLTFYGTVTYNSSSSYGQPVMSNTYKNLTVSGSATRSLTAATTINGNLTLNASLFDAVASSNYGITLCGDWVNAGGTFNAQAGTVTFAGTGLQNFNVTVAGASTAYNADFTFYNVIINNSSSSGVNFYYSNTNSRRINMTDFTVNNSCKFLSIGQ